MDNKFVDNDSQISQLEATLLAQAESLVREQNAASEAAREHLLKDLAVRLQAAEEHELQAARNEAERLFRSQTQAAEIRLAADLDRQRWALTQATLAQVRQAFRALVADGERYRPVLEGWLAAAAKALPPGDLQVAARPADLGLLGVDWPALVARVAPGRQAELVSLLTPSEGGLLVRLSDGRAQVDQTFEARQQRLADDLARITMEHLFASAPDLGTLVHA